MKQIKENKVSYLHKKRSFRLTALALALTLIFLPGALSKAPAPVVSVRADSTTESIRDQIAAVQAEQERIQSEIAAIDEESAQSAENKQLNDELAGATQYKIYLSQGLITQYENQIAMAETDIAELQTKLDATMERYLERVRETYEDGSAQYIELILGSESITDFLSRIDRINAIMEYDRDLMTGYKKDLEALKTKEEELSVLKEAEEETKSALKEDQEEYERRAAIESENIARRQQDKEALQEEYAQNQAAIESFNAELEAVIAEFQRQQEAQSSITYSPSGDYIRPVSGGYISQVFGEMTFGYAHRGYDIAVAAGTPIMAAANGIVVTSGWHSSWGNYVVIDHGNGVTTLYAHCSALIASAGQYVEQGQTVGLVGNTGFSFGNHVHVEVAVNGQLVDGAAYIPF